jgi:hypothetical protein
MNRRRYRIRRIGGLVVGIGIGTVVAAIPWIAWADPFPPPFDPNDIAISFNGMTLFQVGSATATSGAGDFAFADGAGSTALAGVSNSGQFDSAVAYGTDSIANTEQGDFNSAFADGDHSDAVAGGGTLNFTSNGDFASAVGTHTTAIAVALTAPSHNDVASVFDPFGSLGSTAEAIDGNFDLAAVVGDDSLAKAGSIGNFDLSEVFGNALDSTTATGGNFLTDILSALFSL